MIQWLAVKSLFGAPRWLLGLALLVLIGGLVGCIVSRVDSTVKTISTTARDAGKAEAVAAGQETTLKQVEKANEVATEIRDDRHNARFCECVRSATKATARNCVRYLSDESVLAQSVDPGRSCPG
jgi:hypothetical protein